MIADDLFNDGIIIKLQSQAPKYGGLWEGLGKEGNGERNQWAAVKPAVVFTILMLSTNMQGPGLICLCASATPSLVNQEGFRHN